MSKLLSKLALCWHYLSNDIDEVMIYVDPSKITDAERIFLRYRARQVWKQNVEHRFIYDGFAIRPTDSEPDRIELIYLLESEKFDKLVNDLYENNIAGVSRHNKVFRRRYAFGKKFVDSVQTFFYY